MIYPEKYKYMFQVKCETQVYHPNIDLDGNVCLNILREDWKPVLTINAIVYGIQYLFLVSKNKSNDQEYQSGVRNSDGHFVQIPYAVLRRRPSRRRTPLYMLHMICAAHRTYYM